MLNSDEELWCKELSPTVEELLNTGKDPLADRAPMQAAVSHRGGGGGGGGGKLRDRTRVVTFRVPHNAAVQIYDYKEKKAR